MVYQINLNLISWISVYYLTFAHLFFTFSVLESCTQSPWLQKNGGSLARYGHSSVVIGKRVYIFAGNRQQHARLNDLLCINLERQTLGELRQDNPPLPRNFHSCSVHNNSFIIYGGKENTWILNDLFRFTVGLFEFLFYILIVLQ